MSPSLIPASIIEIAPHLQRVMAAARAHHLLRHRDMGLDLRDRLDRRAGGDPAHHRHLARRRLDRHRAARRIGPVARDHPRLETRALHRVGHLHDLDGPRAMRQTPDEAAFLQRRDQPVDAGFWSAGPAPPSSRRRRGGTPSRCTRPWMNSRRSRCLRVSIGSPSSCRRLTGRVQGMFYPCSLSVSTNHERSHRASGDSGRFYATRAPAWRGSSWGGRTRSALAWLSTLSSALSWLP